MVLDVCSASRFKRTIAAETSPRMMSTAERAVNDLQGATAMLSRASLAEAEPPPIQYGFLVPTSRQRKRGRSGKGKGKDADQDHATEKHLDMIEVDSPEEANETQPLGVRLLLKEWTIGEDPRDYTYVNPYTTANDSFGANISRRPTYLATPTEQKPPTIGPQTQIKALQRPTAPPTIGGGLAFQLQATQPLASLSKLLPTSPHALRAPFSSQAIGSHSQASDSPWASTQPVAGAFGSRTSIAAKTKVKKRVGGF